MSSDDAELGVWAGNVQSCSSSQVLRQRGLCQGPYGPPLRRMVLSCWRAYLLKLSVQFSRSVVSDSLTPGTAACWASLSLTNSWSLPKLISIELVMPSNHVILCHPLLLPPSIFPSIRVFSNESALPIRWAKYWCFSFSITPSNEYSGLISFRMDWLDLLAV